MLRALGIALFAAAVVPAAMRPVTPAIAFEPNRGQAPAGVAFIAHTQQGAVHLSASSAAFILEDGTRITLDPGARSTPIAESPISGATNYLRGPRERWITRVPHFERVRYRNLYPGIDLVFYASQGAIEYDFIVAPHADPGRIRFSVRGARTLTLEANGDLRIESSASHLVQHRPVVHQDGEIPGRFVVRGNQVRFAVGAYDTNQPLVIDPVLRFGTYLGGRSRDFGNAIAVDSAGNTYLAGNTVSADFPISANALQNRHAGVPNGGITGVGGDLIFDAFVTKLSADGARVVYSTYLGGSADDRANAIAVDAAGNAVIAGRTTSPNFPITDGALQTAFPSGALASAAFVAKLNADGSNLVFSTLFSGTSGDTEIRALALDPNAVYIAGGTSASTLPVTAGALQSKLAGSTDGFAAKLNARGTAVLYATYLGGQNEEQVNAIALDATGNLYLAGASNSRDFPATAGAPQVVNAGNGDAWLAKLNPTGTALVYATLLGGNDNESASALALDRDGSALVAGSTASPDFPTTPGAFQRTAGPGFHAFVARYDPAGGLTFSTLLGGANVDGARALAVLPDGTAVVGGTTSSPDFPLTPDAYQLTLTGNNCVTINSPFPQTAPPNPCSDGFLTLLQVSGRRMLYSTLLGGAGDDSISALALGPDGAIHLTGTTGSNDFVTTRGTPGQSRSGGTCMTIQSPTFSTSSACEDAFVLKFDPGVTGTPRPVAMIANAASGLAGAIAPGEVVALYGIGIGPAIVGAARTGADGRLLTTLNGTTVTFDGIAAPLLYVGPNQINAVVPFVVAGKSAVTVRIETADYAANVAVANVVAAAPGVFGQGGTGQGQAAALNQDGSINSASNAAPRGEIVVLYGTGAGLTAPQPLDGQLAPATSQVVAPVVVTIGGRDAEVRYAGAAPTLVEGIIQINARIPAGVTPGPQVPITLQVGTVATAAQIFIAVR